MDKARLAIDIGGTCTELAVVLGSKRVGAKVLTTPRAAAGRRVSRDGILMQRVKLMAPGASRW